MLAEMRIEMPNLENIGNKLCILTGARVRTHSGTNMRRAEILSLYG